MLTTSRLVTIGCTAFVAAAVVPVAPGLEPPPADPPQLPTDVPEITLDQLLANYYAAIGGTGRIETVDRLSFEGRRVQPARIGAENEVPFTLALQRPNALRLELVVRNDRYVQAYDGVQAWHIWPAWGDPTPQKMPETSLLDLQKEFEFVSDFVDYERKGHVIELVGHERLEERETLLVKVQHASGELRKYSFDASSFLPTFMTTIRSFGGKNYDVEVELRDYRSVDGLFVAHESILKVSDGALEQLITLKIDHVKVNPDFPRGHFSMPPLEASPDAAGSSVSQS